MRTRARNSGSCVLQSSVTNEVTIFSKLHPTEAANKPQISSSVAPMPAIKTSWVGCEGAQKREEVVVEGEGIMKGGKRECRSRRVKKENVSRERGEDGAVDEC